eukprot:1519633-Heterocapsa_arctica.AAC.1
MAARMCELRHPLGPGAAPARRVTVRLLSILLVGLRETVRIAFAIVSSSWSAATSSASTSTHARAAISSAVSVVLLARGCPSSSCLARPI